MKIALVHDYIGEFGGAERVLLALSEIYPDAPIYTAFTREGRALDKFKSKKVITSWAQKVPFFASFLHSPLRFLAPFIWGSFAKRLSEFDVVITSSSWYVTKGFGYGGPTSSRLRGAIGKPIEICYCHTPPRYLYGYETAVDTKKNILAVIYSIIVNPFMRYYDFMSAQKVDYFIANSENVAKRIKKFYRRNATVIYPPVELKVVSDKRQVTGGKYYLIVARIVGAKGIEMAVEACQRLNVPLKIVGEAAGYSNTLNKLKENSNDNVEFLGFVEDSELVELYKGAKAFLALAQDEDFGITPVESMQSGTPVIAYKGGGYLETVLDPSANSGQAATGVFFDNYSVEGLIGAMNRLNKLKISAADCKKQGDKFSKKVFQEKIKEFVQKHAGVA